MFTIKTDKQIGQYLSRKILHKYTSYSEFCREYMKLQKCTDLEGSAFDNMKNRISQIVKGKKAVQTHDLPLFTELLDVTCEAILSAGEYATPRNNRLTNYAIAFSKDRKEWESYINREDKLILNQDEYGKNVIDYALECNNYEFLKYLVDKKYIWFVGENDKDFSYTLNFGAGTSIKRRQFHYRDNLEYKLAEEATLRSKMISLAIDHKDLDMLNKLKAREIPSLYGTSFLGLHMPDCDKYFDEEMVEHISASENEEIISYFAEAFIVTAQFGKKYWFLFPYISKLLEMLLRNKSKYADLVLVKVIEHNKLTYEKLKKLIGDAYHLQKESFSWITDEKQLAEKCNADIARELDFYENGQIVNFRQVFTPNQKSSEVDGITTNIIYVNASSNNSVTQRFIQEANEWFEKIRKYQNKFNSVTQKVKPENQNQGHNVRSEAVEPKNRQV